MKKLSLILTLITATLLVQAQVVVNVSANPNPNLSAWADRSETVTITITNSGPETQAKILSTLSLNGDLKAETQANAMPLVTLQRGVNIFRAEDIIPYSAVKVYQVNAQQIARTGQLPAGTYQYCVNVVDAQNQPLSRFPQSCRPFLISQIQPPVLVLPADKGEVRAPRPTFNWTPIAPIPQGMSINYRVLVFEVLPGQNPIQAAQSNRPILNHTSKALSMPWPPDWELPTSGQQLVWTVRAEDDEGNPIGENRGLAELRTFSWNNGQTKAAGGDPYTICVSHACYIKGVKLELTVPIDAATTGSTSYKISAYSIPIKYYATAAQVLNEFGTTGAPEVDDWIGYISSSDQAKYCDKNGFPIVNQVVYEVTKTNPNNYNGNTNTLHSSGVCFDYTSYTALATHYNAYNNSYADVPTGCSEGCIEGGSNPDNPITGGNFNAAGDEIDDITLDPVDDEDPIGGGITPGSGLPGKPANPQKPSLGNKPSKGNPYGNQNKAADGDGWTQCVNFTCRIKGSQVGIYVPSDAATTGSTQYKVVAYSTPIKYYATAAQVINEFGTTGAAEVDDWIGYISSSDQAKYCDKNGFPIQNQVVYEVTKTNPNNYNGNTNTLHASGVCFDYNNYTNLANHYNAYNGGYADLPTSCSEGCMEGGSNPNTPFGGGNVNAANEEIDDITLDPVDDDDPIGGGGIVNNWPNLEMAPENISNGIVVIDGNGIITLKQRMGRSKRVGNYCRVGDKFQVIGDDIDNDCDDPGAEMVSPCECPVAGVKAAVLSTLDCKSACKVLSKSIKRR